MHNCRLTRNVLIDLALDEMPTAEATRLLAELNDCAACREEYATLRNTWRVSGQALQSALPKENFWPGYHARLQGKLIELQEETEKVSSSLPLVQPSLNSPRWLPVWSAVVKQTVSLRLVGRKLATSSIRVPVPVALALVFLFGISVLALFARGTLGLGVPATPSTQSPAIETRIVEIPVIQEKVVTRVVYVQKKDYRSRGEANQLNREDLNAANRLVSAGPDASGKTAMSLVGFKPTDQVKLTIIKGSYQDEK